MAYNFHVMVERIGENLRLQNPKSIKRSVSKLMSFSYIGIMGFVVMGIAALSGAAIAVFSGGMVVVGIVGTWALLKSYEGLRMYTHDYKYYIPPDKEYKKLSAVKRKRTIAEKLTDAIHFRFHI